MPAGDTARRGMGWAGAAALAAMLLTPAVSAGKSAVEGESANPYAQTGAIAGSGTGKRIGYISLGDELPCVRRVTESIIEQAAVAPARLRVAGRADTEPVASNETEDGRRRNRRIEIILLPAGEDGDPAS